MVPNLLTLSRIVVIPIIVGCFYTGTKFAKYLILILFIFACITDFLDGYIARHYKQTSLLGKCLDPVADKMLVSCILLFLAGFHFIQGINIIPTVIILFREILVSGMREFLNEIKIPLPVTFLAKLKTSVQMLALVVILLANAIDNTLCLDAGITLLWIAATLTLITGYQYFEKGIKHIKL